MLLYSAFVCFSSELLFLFVVRGYVTGSTDTSLWTVYKKGVRNYCGNALSDGKVSYCCHL